MDLSSCSRVRFVFPVLSILTLLALPRSATADIVTWINPLGGNWGTAANWSSFPQLPAPTDTVTITSAGTYTVTLDVSATVARLELGGTSGTQTLTIAANTLTLDGPSVVNANGVFLESGGTITGAGALTIHGVMHWTGGVMSVAGGAAIGTGQLTGSGVVTGDIANTGGVVAPGPSAAALDLVGNYTQGAGGATTLEIGGLTAGTQYDQLNLSGPTGVATLNGTLNVSLTGGFDPALGNSFTIVNCVSRSGQFSAEILPALGTGLAWQVAYNATSVVLTVISSAPVLGAIGDRTVAELAALAFTATATDPDAGQTRTFSLDAGAPTGASIVGSSGAFSWTPTEAQGPSSAPITVRVTDNDTPPLSDFEAITATVNEVNIAPVLAAIGNRTTNVGVTVTFTATATDADLPANTITYSLDAGAPAGATIDPSTGAFTWTPGLGQVGAEGITVRATDNGTPVLSGSQVVLVTVNANQPPVLTSIGDKTVNELTALTFTATATDPNVPADALTFSLDAGAPAGAAINGTTGAFTWTPTEAQSPGDFPVTVRVTDNGTPSMNDFELITATVNEVNVAPVLGAIGSKTVAELAALTFTATATDADLPANALALSLDAGSPAGAAINATTGAFTWTATEAQGPGDFNIVVRVTDNGNPALNDLEVVGITVNEVNVAPVLGAVGNKTVAELAALTFTATATDADLPANALTYSLDAGAPAGAAINPTTGAFSWTPTEAQGPGAFPITVRVTDDGAGTLDDSEAITVTVTEVNVAPVLGAIGNKTVAELVTLTFTATATDADLPSNALAVSLDAGSPAGAAINATTGAFAWTPTEAQGPGAFPITVRVADDGTPALNDFELITTTVTEVNVAPVLGAIGNRTVAELATLAFTATATDADLPADALAFSLDAGAPAGAAINATTGAFAWTPTEAQGPGSFPITVRVTDDGTPAQNDFEAITVTVTEVNIAPVVTNPGDQTINELATLTFTATATDADTPGNTVTWSLDPGAPGTDSINGTTGAYSWTPNEGQGPGTFGITIRATDNGTPALSGTAAVTITVDEVNVAPVLGAIGNRTVAELATLAFTATATDADSPANARTFTMDAGSPAGSTINATTGAFSWTSTEAQGPGAFPITVRVTDDGTPALNDTELITVTVSEVNVAPVLGAIGNKTVAELAALTFTASATDADIPANTVTYSLDAGAPTGAGINATTGAISWTPTEAQGPGAFPITVRATDNGTPGLNDFETITVTVVEGNASPVLGAISNRTVAELVALTFTSTATDADLPADALTFSLDAGNPTGSAINATTGAFAWTPTEAQGPGSFPITIRVTDDGAGTLDDSEAITVTVSEVNVAPVLGAIGNRTVAELAALTFTATATDADLPANARTFSLDAGSPAGAAINATTGAFSWTPTEAQGPGAFPITVRVTDNGTPALNDFEAITVTVTEVNVAPVFGAIGNKTVAELATLTFTATETDADLPANALTFSLDAGSPTGAAINATTGAFSWTPTEAQGPGTFPITVRVTDNGTPALNDFEAITVTVSELNVAPVLAAIGNKTVAELVALTFTAAATDADLPANELTYSLDAGSPAGAAINATTGAFAWTPTEAQGPGSFPITVRVTDNGTPTLNDFEAIAVTVSEVNVAPVLGAIGNRTLAELATLTFTATATDADIPADALAFSLDTGSPVGAAINATTGTFAWTPTEAQGPGSFPITIRVTDDGTPALNDFELITVTVTEGNAAPALTAIGNRTVNELVALAFTATATDTDLPADALIFSLDVGNPTGSAINATTGAFTWTPTEAQGPGSFPITIRVTDDGTPALDDSELITITVNEANATPALGAIGSKTVSETVALAFTATATDIDSPANALTFSLDAGNPAGSTINATTGAFTWTPTEAQGPGNFNIVVRVTDNGTPALNDLEVVDITVNEVNRPPLLAAIGNRTVNELATLAFTATASDPDLPANSRTFSLDAGNPAGSTINGTTGAFSWTPTEAQGPGSSPITVRVTDSGTPALSDFEAFTVTVTEVNTAPVVTSPGDRTVAELTTLAFTVAATDADLPTNSWTFSLDAGAPAGSTINPTTDEFSWTPTEAQGPGTFPITIRATDDGTPALSGTASITVTVTEAGGAPVVTSPGNRTIAELATLVFTVTATDADIPADTVTWSLDAGSPTGATINTTTGAFSWTPTEAQGPGSFPTTIRATDDATPPQSGTAAITVTVTEVNVAPALSAIGNRTVNELATLAFTATATDADLPANALTFSLGAGAPAGSAINAATGAFSWTPTEAQGPGSFPITVRATDNGTPALNDFEAITVTVAEVNATPVVVSPGNQAVDELTALAFTVTATDADIPANTRAWSLDAGNPAGSTIHATTGAFSWTPAEVQGPGSYPVTIRATDNGTPAQSGTAAITITVSEVNAAPALAAIGARTVNELVTLSFTATATDTDLPTNTLTFSLDAGNPAGSTIHPTTGALIWTPTEAQGPGVYPVTVRVTDDGTPAQDDLETINVTVSEVNAAPALAAIGSRTVNELATLAFTATSTDADLPANPLTYTLDTGAPAGATINATTGAFSWNPTEAQGPGTFPITVRVTDNGTPTLDDSEGITVTVTSVNVAPVLNAIGNKAGTVGVAITFTVTATDADLPANTLAFSLDAGNPAGSTINAATGSFGWTPAANGSFPMTVRVTDNGTPALNDFEAITITVSPAPNQAPVLGAIGNRTVNELATLAFTATATDPDAGDVLTFSLDAGAPSGAAINGTTDAFTWTPTEAQGPASSPITVRVTDSDASPLSDTETITVTVNEVNAPPALAAIGSKTVNELATLAFTATATDADLPANALTFSLDAGAPAGAAINGATGAFSWAPTEAQGPGSYPVTIRVTDNGTPPSSDFELISVVVSEVNATPALAVIGDRTVNELAALTFTATATDADIPPNTLTFSLDAGNPSGSTINGATGAFTWTPTELQGPGTIPIAVRVTDSGTPSLAGLETFAATVNEVNGTPVLAAIGNRTVNELAALTFTATATDADLPANALTYSLDAGNPAGSAINAATGAFAWTPTEAQGPGSYPITIRATDDGTPGLSDFEPITVTVNEVNAAPALVAIGNKTVNELVALTFTVAATDADLPSNARTFSLDSGNPTGSTINATTGAFSWTPNEGQGPGSYPITVRVTDTGTPALTDFEPITVTVNEVNAAPVVTNPGNRTVDELVALAFTVTAADADVPANAVTWSLDAGAPVGATINPTTDAFSWTPTEAQGPGIYPVTFRATDNGSPALSGTAAITITVDEVNVAPTLVAIGNKAGTVGLAINFTATATDADLPANALAFSLDAGAPSGVTIQATTGAFSWTPATNGSFPMTVRVTDNGSPARNDFEAITIAVSPAPNQGPALGAIGDQTVDELATLTFTATATDPDAGSILTFSLDAGAPLGATINGATGAFSWTPTEAQGPSDHPITVRVTDNGSPLLSDSETITVTVNEGNVAPVLAAIGDKTVNELAALNFTATATDADLPANTRSFTLGSGAPAGATMNATNGAFSWTPTELQGPGTFPITVVVTDNGTPAQTDDETITVTVNEGNVAPVFAAIGDKTVDELTPLTFTATATDADLPINTLSFSLGAGAPAGATIQSTTGAFTWPPSEVRGPGSIPVTVIVTDDGTPALNDSETITVTVNEVNVAPVLVGIGDRAGTVGIPVTFTATATDADLPENGLGFSLDVGAPTGATIQAATGAFTWTPTANGSFPVTVRVTDDGTPSLSDFEAISIEVSLAPNQSPVLGAIGDRTVNEGTPLSFTATATDPDAGQALTFTLDAGAPAGAAITAGGAFTWTPAEDQGPGAIPITVRVTDDGTPNLSDPEAITVTVYEVNVAPILATIGNRTVTAGVPLTFTATATDADLPANTLAFSLTAGAPAGAAIDAASGAFHWIPPMPGVYPVTVRVTDNGTPARTASEMIMVTVGDASNVAPILGAIGARTVNESSPLTFTATATDPDPNQTRTFSLDAGSPAGATLHGSTGAFSWTPAEGQGPGTHPITIRVTDNGSPALSDFETVSVTVNEVNVAPILAAIGNRTVTVGAALAFTATATDGDIPANIVSFSLDAGAPVEATIDPTTGAFGFTGAAAGSYPVTVRVTDNGAPSLGDFEAITITVAGPPAPRLLAIGDATVIEKHEGIVEAKFRVTLSPANSLPVTVDFTVTDSTATAPSDYAATQGRITFATGGTIQYITVKVMGDRRFEQNEVFLVRLTNAVNASIADGDGIGTIQNDDAAVAVRPHTAWYWRNHPTDIAMYLPQTLGGMPAATVDQAITVLKLRYDPRDGNNRLRAELLAALLNLANGASGASCIQPTVSEAQSFLTAFGHLELRRRSYPIPYRAAGTLTERLRAYNHARIDCLNDLFAEEDHDLVDPEGGPESAQELAVLEPNFPNPFNGNTRIEYLLSATTHARLAVYDVQGREVKVLVDAQQGQGLHLAEWDGTGRNATPMASGVYFYRLTVGAETLMGRMILAR